MNQSVILTVVGSDRPGLTRAIADAVFSAGGNWLESHLSRLGGKYVGSGLVELPAERLGHLNSVLRSAVGERRSLDLIRRGGGAPEKRGGEGGVRHGRARTVRQSAGTTR